MSRIRTTTIVTAWLASTGCTGGAGTLDRVIGTEEVDVPTPPGTPPIETTADTGDVPGTMAPKPTGDTGR